MRWEQREQGEALSRKEEQPSRKLGWRREYGWAHATQGVSSPSLSQGAGRAQDAGGNPGGCDVKRPGGLCRGAVCPRHCPKAIAPVRLHPHPCSMFSPAAKQETSAGPWIHYVNKYTEDFRAFEGNRVFGRKPGPAQPAFLAEKPVQAAGQPGPA